MSQNINSRTRHLKFGYISIFTTDIHFNNFLIFVEFSSTASIFPANIYIILWCR